MRLAMQIRLFKQYNDGNVSSGGLPFESSVSCAEGQHYNSPYVATVEMRAGYKRHRHFAIT